MKLNMQLMDKTTWLTLTCFQIVTPSLYLLQFQLGKDQYERKYRTLTYALSQHGKDVRRIRKDVAKSFENMDSLEMISEDFEVCASSQDYVLFAKKDINPNNNCHRISKLYVLSWNL